MSAPRAVADELYRLFEQMKNNFGARLAQLEQSNNSLINEIKEKDVESDLWSHRINPVVRW